MLQAGHRHRTPRLDLAWRSNDAGHARLGVIVPRFGHTAVARNRLRRQLREMARRRLLPTLPPFDLVIRSRPPAYLAPRERLATDLEQWLQGLTA